MIDYTLPLDELPDPLPIVPLERPFDVTITPPGSKSITNRAYVLAALAEGESRIVRPLRSEDTDGLLEALGVLGAEARWDGEDVLIKGVNGRFPRGGSVNLGDGGTPTRFMIAAACLAAEPVVVDGSQRMRERPIAEGVDMLRKLGATIEYVEEEGRLPVRVVPSERFKGGELTVGKTASSQFVSAVMLIGPWLERGVRIDFSEVPTSVSYLHISVACLLDWDAEITSMLVDDDEPRIAVFPRDLHSTEIVIEPDASSAAYWIVAAAITGSHSRIPFLPFHSQQPDVYVAKRLQPEVWQWNAGEQWGSDVRWPVKGAVLRSIETDASVFPDGAMALCVAAACADRPSTITGLHTLRVKETDRIAALANELRKVGCAVETTDDSITITPPPGTAALRAANHDSETRGTGANHDSETRGTGANHDSETRGTGANHDSETRGTGANHDSETRGTGANHDSETRGTRGSHDSETRGTKPVTIETYNDHRMAMSFAILGLVRPGISIANPKCVAKSYPTFWRDFAKLYQ